MRKNFGMLALIAALGMSLLTPDDAFARRRGRRRGYSSAACCNTCGTVSNCGYSACGGGYSGCGTGCSTGYGTGAPMAAPGMSGPPPAPNTEAPPPPTPAPGA